MVRLQYDKFLIDIGKAVFKSEKKFTIEELLENIKDQIIIIDGLDHVENYNVKELNNFISLIDMLTDARVVVFSRPLSSSVPWKESEIYNWTIDETRLYLAQAHGISDCSIQNKVFEISKGYPIITFFLAEHYILHGCLPTETPADNLNKYYDDLLQPVQTLSALCIFATSNSFFTWHELKYFLEDELFDIVQEFINGHPYLFDILLNRVSLIHDSLNAYLRERLKAYPAREEKVNSVVTESILSGNVEFIARLYSFQLDDAYDIILQTYSSFNAFNRLVQGTLDYNSITSFYEQLQIILEQRRDALDIYQYYSFVLIFQIATRNDTIGYTALVYQILKYIHIHGSIENEIFSSGYMWMIYLYTQDKTLIKKMGYSGLRYSSINEGELFNDLNDEATFFERKGKIVEFSELSQIISDPSILNNRKRDALLNYLVGIWTYEKCGEPLYDEFIEYIIHGTINSFSFYAALGSFAYDHLWIELSLSGAKQTLYELGCFDDNRYLKKPLLEIINFAAPKGSFVVASEVLPYLRLANRSRRKVDIADLNYVWTMYYERKDYSVFTIDDALVTFEKHGCLDETLSIEIIHRLMLQSEKGIRHLLCDYIDKKGTQCVLRMKEAGYFNNDSYVDVADLSPEGINCFEEGMIQSVLSRIATRHFTHVIEFDEIENLLNSKYADITLNMLKRSGMQIYGGNADENIRGKIEAYGIKYTAGDVSHRPYNPLENGCIRLEDKEYIREHEITYLQLAKYTDGWYSCLPYPEMFLEYDQEDVRNNYLAVIHNVLSSRVPDLAHFANWNLLIGNIPLFLEQMKVDIEWDKLFAILKDFMVTSFIWCGNNVGSCLE